jgi:putative ABC transport system permease protein
LVDALYRHLRYGLRQIRRQPGLATAVVLTLGLAIGANTTIFSFVNALLIRPFPFRDPDQLVEIHSVRGGQPGKLSMREVLDLKEQIAILDGIAAHTGGAGGYNYSGEGRPEEWRAILTTGNLFEVLGVPLELGAKWPEIVDLKRDYRVILSYEVWKSSFAGAIDVVGKKITLDHAAGYEIHGVAGRGFDFPRGIQVYRSVGGFTSYDKRDSRNVVAIARIKRPHTVARLQAELDAVSHRLAQQFPGSNTGISFRAVSFRNLYSGDVRPYLLILLGAVGLVLLIACGNVANLLLSRALSRGREIAIRIALGASRLDLIGQLLTESAVLALAAAGLGLSLAYWWMKLLRAMIGFELPEWMVIELDGRVLGFTIAISILAGLISGLSPALELSRPSLVESLKEGGRGSSSGRSAGRLRDWMVAGEVALAVVLLMATGLLIRSFLELQSQEKGFRAESIATFRVALGWKRYIDQESIARYYERALDKLGALAGVEGVAFVESPPLARQEESAPSTVQREGQSLHDALHNPYVNLQSISEGYFELMGIALKAGRVFTPFDKKDSEPVAIVSERLARTLWPEKDALGQRLLYNPTARKPDSLRKIVGIVGNVQHRELGGEPSLDIYVPYRQRAAANQYMLVKTRLGLRQFTDQAQPAMWNIDPQQSVFDFKTYEQRILGGIWQLRISRTLLVLFGLVALVLAAIGIYGVMSYVVGQRTREMGIRLALGASPANVQALIVRRGMLLGGIGLTLGLMGALILARVLKHMLRGISHIDPLTFGGALFILVAVTLAACWLPARRASRVDPVASLKQE